MRCEVTVCAQRDPHRLLVRLSAGVRDPGQLPPVAPIVVAGGDLGGEKAVPFGKVREPFTTDPALVERGLRGHADTQNELARVLRDAGIELRSPRPDEPNFDLARQKNGATFVAEIKSITGANQEEQLRLGLGQVLRYRQCLAALGHEHVVAVLVPLKGSQQIARGLSSAARSGSCCSAEKA